MKRCFHFIALLLATTGCLPAQDSLGDAARQARTDRSAQPHAKIVVDDDTAPLKARSPFPEIAVKGLENIGTITRAMEDYRKTHTKQEFADAVHAWFDDYDEMIRVYLREQVLAQERRNDQYTRPQPVYSGDWNKYYEQLRARQRADELDRRQQSMDQTTISRVQQGLDRVHNYLLQRNISYDWFKVRHSANDDD